MGHEDPLVSIVIPNYNRTHLLRLCLRSIKEQIYSPIEVIVVDDCGTGDSAQVARSWGATVLRTNVNSGPSAARNLGAEYARGQILLFLDSDIALDPASVKNAVTTLQSEPRLGALGGILRPESLVSRSLAAQYRALQVYHWFMPTGRPSIELHAAVLAVPAKVFTEIGRFNPHLRDTVSGDFRFRVVQKYDARITAGISGRHDHDSTLRMILHKVFRRARACALDWRRGETPGDSVPRAFAGVLLLAAVLSMPVPLLFGVLGGIVPAIFVVTAIALDRVTYRYGFAHRGIFFGIYFSAVHLLVTFAGALGAGIGVIQRILLSRVTRRRDRLSRQVA